MQEELDVPILGHTPYDGIMPWSNTKESPKSSDFIIVESKILDLVSLH